MAFTDREDQRKLGIKTLVVMAVMFTLVFIFYIQPAFNQAPVVKTTQIEQTSVPAPTPSAVPSKSGKPAKTGAPAMVSPGTGKPIIDHRGTL